MALCDYVEVWEPYQTKRIMACALTLDQHKGMLRDGFVHSMTLTLMRREAFDFPPEFEPKRSVSHYFYVWMQLTLELDAPFVHIARPPARHNRSGDSVTTPNEI